MATKKETRKGNPNNDTPTITLNVVNPAVSGSPTVIYTGVAATLNVTLANLTGSPIVFSQGNTLELFMPGYFSAAEVGLMTITNISIPGLTFSYRAADNLLLLTYNGADFSWANNATLQCAIGNVKCSRPSGNDTLQINPNGLRGFNIPAQISATLLLNSAPLPARVNLKDVLRVDTPYGGEIYISTSLDPLTNNLYLELKNTGTVPLYHGEKPRTGTPKITVSFVYGSTSGSLAPDNKQTAAQEGSAWRIGVGISVDQTGGWNVSNPLVTGAANSPSWTMSPVATNKQIIGVRDQANICFVFSSVFSFTPIGPTQMYVQFSDFPQNDEHTYNDCTFVVPIRKVSPPKDRGIISLSGNEEYFIDKVQDVPVEVQWSAFQTASIRLMTNASPLPVPSPYTKAYSSQTPLIYDSTTLVLPDVKPDTAITFTINAYNGEQKKLKGAQFTTTVKQRPGIYEFSGPATAVNFAMNNQANVLFNWNVYAAGSIQICKGDIVLFRKNYGPSPLRNIDSTSVSVPVSGYDDTQEFTLKCFDREERLLGTGNATVKFAANAWCDPKDRKVYPIVRVGNQIWLGSNYAYNDPQGGSFWYDNDQKYEARFGRLYTRESAIRNIPAGWRLPVDADWATVIQAMKSDAAENVPTEFTRVNLAFGGAYSIIHENPFMCIDMVGIYMGHALTPGCYANFLVAMASTPPQIEHKDMDVTPPDLNGVGFSIRYILVTSVSETYEEGIESKGNPMSEATRKKLLKGAGVHL